jgi:hypothetical protein
MKPMHNACGKTNNNIVYVTIVVQIANKPVPVEIGRYDLLAG